MMRRAIPITIMLLALAVSATPVDRPDTTCVLGGPDRWDGRFENAAGEADWQGWTHADLYSADSTNHWHVSDVRALSGQYSLWCGAWFGGDDGYGNSWHDAVGFSHAVVDPGAASAVRLQASLQVDCEPGYDYLHVQVLRAAGWAELTSPLTDIVETALDVTVTVEPEDYLDGAVTLRFLAESDEGYSDEDGGYPTNGLARLDDVIVTVDGVVVSTEDFESGESTDWLPDTTDRVGDFAALRSGLEDIDPDPAHRNDSWQVSFVDDGVVVPGTGGTPCADWCYGPGGWVFNVTAGLDGHGVSGGPFGVNGGVWNGVVSPCLGWPENADGGEIAFDVYAHMQTYECGVTTYGWTYRVTGADDSAAIDEAAWQPTRWSYFNAEAMPAGPGYVRVSMPLDVTVVPEARWVQVRLEAFEGGPWCWGEYVTQGTPAPYFDNVAVRAWRVVTDVPPSMPALTLDAAPNPFNPRVTLNWRQPVAGSVDLAIYDARGRQVRRLVLDDRAAGAGSVTWDGCDDAGSNVAAGIYLARLRTGAGTETCKLSLVR